jgi:PAS domain S-box-containing protein
MITGADGRLEHANRAFRRALGCESEELAGAPLETFLAPESGPLRREIMEEVEGRGLWRGTLVRRRRDGSTFPASCTVVSLRDEQGRLTHYVGVERDMTDELSRRDQLIHAERLSAVGELVAGVAHELNNPLQTIVGRAELLLAPEADPVRRADLGLIRNEAGRAGAIVRGLLSFARRGTAGRAAADLNDLVTRVVEQRRPALRAHEIEVECRCAPDLPPAQVNAEEIQQVLLNLLLNAEQALSAWPGRRRLTIETALTDGRVQVEVSDSGPGVSAALAGRVFEPFFTTREVGAGAGLGLSLSLGIATAHGGTLALVPAPTGACFRLSLPAGAYADL